MGRRTGRLCAAAGLAAAAWGCSGHVPADRLAGVPRGATTAAAAQALGTDGELLFTRQRPDGWYAVVELYAVGRSAVTYDLVYRNGRLWKVCRPTTFELDLNPPTPASGGRAGYLLARSDWVIGLPDASAVDDTPPEPTAWDKQSAAADLAECVELAALCGPTAVLATPVVAVVLPCEAVSTWHLKSVYAVRRIDLGLSVADVDRLIGAPARASVGPGAGGQWRRYEPHSVLDAFGDNGMADAMEVLFQDGRAVAVFGPWFVRYTGSAAGGS